MDSTAILLELISDPVKYPSVRVVSCGLKNTFNYEEDKLARENIAKILNLTELKNVEYVTEEVQCGGPGGSQATVWAWLSAMYVDILDENNVELVYGYIRHDDFWHKRTQFESAVESLVKIHSAVKPTFCYPLEWKTKREVVSTYLHYPEVFRALSWGGDTRITKAKEREDLEFIFDQLQLAKKSTTENTKK